MSDARDIVDSWNRKWRTLWVWSQLYVGYKAAQAKSRLLHGEQRQAFWEERHSHWAENVWSNIAELRGWWVKVGQFLSTRSDLLPSQYIKHLAKLQDMMPTSEYSIISKIVEEELGAPIEDIFSEFSEKAIASASIGQVHTAVLRSTGEKVVVKVQHPGVEKTLKQDMVTLTQMTWAFGLLEKGLNFVPILDEWQKSAANELDFRLEHEYQERARKAALKASLDVIIPKCYEGLITKKVLVMEFCPGFKVTDTESLECYNVDVNSLMIKICKAFAHQIHVDGLFNGDPHPGNILVQIHPETNEATPVLLDWGLVKCFTFEEKLAFAKAVYSVANMDVMGLMAAFEDMGFRFKSDSPIDPEIYMDTLRIGFFRDTGESINTSEKDIASDAWKQSKLSKEDVMQKNPIDDWPKDIIFFLRVAALLHGLSLQLKAKVPFLELLVEKAEECLCNQYIAPSPSVYYQYPKASYPRIRGMLEWKVFKFLRYLLIERHLLLGCQVAIYQNGRLIVDVSVGKMGPTNNRPVMQNSLFCIMGAANGLLATAVLKLIANNKLSLNDPVCHWWDGFIRFNKQSITVRDVLSHKAGLHKALPKDLKLSQLTDYETMISILENAYPDKSDCSSSGRFAYLTSGWLLSEIVRGVTGMRIDDYVKTNFIRRLKLQNEMFYPLPKLSSKTQQSRSNLIFNEESHSKKTVLESANVPDKSKKNVSIDDTVSHDYPSVVDELKGVENLSEIIDRDENSNTKGVKGAPEHVERFRTSVFVKTLSNKRQSDKPRQNSKAAAGNYVCTTSRSCCNQQQCRCFHISNLFSPNEDNRSGGYEPLKNTLRGESGISSNGNKQSSLSSGCSTIDEKAFSYIQDLSVLEDEGVIIEDEEGLKKNGIGEHKFSNEQQPSCYIVDKRNVFELNKDLINLKQVETSPQKDEKVYLLEIGKDNYKKRTSIPLQERLVSSRRQLGVPRITQEEVNAKLTQVQNYSKCIDLSDGESKFLKNIPSKYLHKLAAKKQALESQNKNSSQRSNDRCTPIELAKLKPHVLDPLIYDSRRIHSVLIPGTNCRSTARALARFYSCIASGKLIRPDILAKAAQPVLIDTSIDALLLTGGQSRVWGLGYQLFPCIRNLSGDLASIKPQNSINTARVEKNDTKKKVVFSEPSKFNLLTTNVISEKSELVVGLGHGDMGGSVALCIPELNLSIAILLNDILSGPLASREILNFILNCFGLEPAWEMRQSMENVLSYCDYHVKSKTIAQASAAAAILKKEMQFTVQ